MNNEPDKLRIKKAAIKKIQDVASKCSHFKIGKTGQNLSDRFDSEYKSIYDRIVLVHKSNDSTEVDDLEKDLIKYFKENWVLELKREVKKIRTGKTISNCDNDAIGGGEMDDSDTYYVYVVVKD